MKAELTQRIKIFYESKAEEKEAELLVASYEKMGFKLIKVCLGEIEGESFYLIESSEIFQHKHK